VDQLKRGGATLAALLLGLLCLAAFLWALRSGQFDDLDGAAERIFYDDEDR
jgi:cbb3-type cytochrome oxidase maturation protein